MGLPALHPDDPKTACRGGARNRFPPLSKQSRRLPRQPFHQPRLARRGWVFQESSRTSRPAICNNDQLHHRRRFHGSLVLQANQMGRSVGFRFVVLWACFGFSEVSLPEFVFIFDNTRCLYDGYAKLSGKLHMVCEPTKNVGKDFSLLAFFGTSIANAFKTRFSGNAVSELICGSLRHAFADQLHLAPADGKNSWR